MAPPQGAFAKTRTRHAVQVLAQIKCLADSLSTSTVICLPAFKTTSKGAGFSLSLSLSQRQLAKGLEMGLSIK